MTAVLEYMHDLEWTPLKRHVTLRTIDGSYRTALAVFPLKGNNLKEVCHFVKMPDNYFNCLLNKLLDKFEGSNPFLNIISRCFKCNILMFYHRTIKTTLPQ